MTDSLISDNLHKLEQSLTNRKHSVRLPEMKVSIAAKKLMESAWISASESLLE